MNFIISEAMRTGQSYLSSFVEPRVPPERHEWELEPS